MKWVTRKRIHVNRTATAWLIRRFLDPKAEIVFVDANEVAAIQERENAIGFDVPGARYPHQDERGIIGPVAGVFITIATVIDAGVFATLGPATDRAGTGILLSVVLAGLIALASGTSGAQLGSAFQVSGGAFIWTRKVGLPTVSFAAGLCFLGKEIVGQSVNALVLIGY